MTAHTAQSLPLVNLLIDLANEIDGVADFGITVCLIDEGKMAGRERYIMQQSAKIHAVVDSIVALLNNTPHSVAEQMLLSQAELLAGSLLLSSGFKALRYFRKLTAETLCIATESLRGGWEAIHKSIVQIADALGLCNESWYCAILERQDSYRVRLQHLFSGLQEVVHTGTN